MNPEILVQILDYTNAFVVVLDSEMKIRYINLALVNKLGFEDHKDLIDRCWLDFISEKLQERIKKVHRTLLTTVSNECDCNEYINEILDKNGNPTLIKWLNMAINSETNWTFSIGVPERTDLINRSADEIRQEFKSAIASDRTMIKSLKDYVKGIPQSFNLPDTCDLTEK